MKTLSIAIEDHSIDHSLPISGVKFEPNICYESANISNDIFVRKLITSPGPYISDYVTHQNDFKYTTLGIHVGQTDRLTFMGGEGKNIVGHLIDCRKDSSTYGTRIKIEYKTSMYRKLIIPMGVAHSFENLQHVITRDEPIWYSSFHNPDWDISNDLISIPLDIEYKNLPRIEVNKFLLPIEGHIFFSQLQQDNLRTAKRYALRSKSETGQYHIQANKDWTETAIDFESVFHPSTIIPDVKWLKNSYALTGPKSYTVVPSTRSCVSDVIELDFQFNSSFFRCHKRQNSFVTFLDREGEKICIDLIDLRQSSRLMETLQVTCDPRVRLVIPAGVAYRFKSHAKHLIRFEREILLDKNEPRTDLPKIGSDCLLALEEDLRKMPIFSPPHIICPDKAIWLIVDAESML